MLKRHLLAGEGGIGKPGTAVPGITHKDQSPEGRHLADT
jgi:hypothetical protein